VPCSRSWTATSRSRAPRLRSPSSLVGSYRPPLGDLGACLERAVLHRVAQSTFRGFLGDLRDALSAATPADDVDLDLENVLRK
jgi:hypothetical protein